MCFKKGLLFGYSYFPACGEIGDVDGGFSIEILNDRKVIYKTYMYNGKEKSISKYKVSKKTIESIEKIIALYQAEINAIEEHIDNGTCDGYGNKFVFREKEILTWNIEWHDETELKKKNPQYYNKYISIIQQENILLLIFARIRKVLIKQGIFLTIEKVKIGMFCESFAIEL